MENGVENYPLMKGSTTELFKTWLRADHEFVVMCTPRPHAFSSGCSQQSWRWEVERHFFFFFLVQRWELGSQGGQRTFRILAKEVKHPWAG